MARVVACILLFFASQLVLKAATECGGQINCCDKSEFVLFFIFFFYGPLTLSFFSSLFCLFVCLPVFCKVITVALIAQRC